MQTILTIKSYDIKKSNIANKSQHSHVTFQIKNSTKLCTRDEKKKTKNEQRKKKDCPTRFDLQTKEDNFMKNVQLKYQRKAIRT